MQPAFLGFLMRAAAVEAISRKSLCLSSRARVLHTDGRLITAISADTGFISNAFPFAVAAIADPLVIILGLVLLIVNLGPSALVVSLRMLPFTVFRKPDRPTKREWASLHQALPL